MEVIARKINKYFIILFIELPNYFYPIQLFVAFISCFFAYPKLLI